MRKNGLRPRAVGALVVVAASLFLLLCLFNYGSEGLASAVDPALHLRIAGWFVGVFGIGAYALVVLPLAWGLVVYFREDTPSLTMRAVGTGLLACAAAMISGLLQAHDPGLWAGSIGSFTASVVAWMADALGGQYGASIAMSAAWLTSVVVFVVALIWSTDWMFHTLRRGPVQSLPRSTPHIPTEPVSADLREPDEVDTGERTVVTVPSPGAGAAQTLATEPAPVDEPLPEPELPEGFSARKDNGRVVLQGPVGYDGVEFLPTNDELAAPDAPEERVAHRAAATSTAFVEDDFVDDEYEIAAETTDEAPETTDVGATPAAASEADDLLARFAEAAEVEPAAERADDTPAVESPDASSTETEPAAEPPADTDDERPRSGIGLPADGPFVDEFFTVGSVIDAPADAPEPPRGDDGASSAAEVAATYGVEAASAGESSESRDVTEPGDTPELPFPEETAASAAPADDAVVVDEVFFAPAAFALIDDEVPSPIAERASSRPATDDTAADTDAGRAPATDESVAPEDAAARIDLARLDETFADPLLEEAVEAVLEAGRSSPMLLQRRFGIGHARGLRLIEQMEQVGIVGPEDDLGGRALLVSMTEWEQATGSRSGTA